MVFCPLQSGRMEIFMISELNATPKALRVHIGVFGDTNAGKSTLINSVTGQEIALTSPVAGTTADPVYKPMELLPIGPVVFIDTAGMDDSTDLGEIRIKKSIEQLEICDCAILAVSAECSDLNRQKKYIGLIKERKIPFLIAVNEVCGKKAEFSLDGCGTKAVYVDFHSKDGAERLKAALIELLAERDEEPVLTGNLVKAGDLAVLVAPQDAQAPKGRLIMPEVQVTRDLLDNGCMVMTVTGENTKKALESLSVTPALVVTDSQIFKTVNESVPKDIPLTSFSLLMAKIKGDINGFIKGAEVIESLNDGDKVLIIESCSHHAMDGDIARVKIPGLLKKYTGKNLEIHNVSGQKTVEELSQYKLAIHCGGCMINRKAMLQKQKLFENAGVPMTNFGAAIAYMNKMLERVCY